MEAEATITVEVISTHRNIMYLFTPNNDGFNDLWEIPELESYGRCSVRVYNRWGKLVFSSPDYHNEWDGTSDGVNLPPAAYYFIIKTEKPETITGTVNIVR
jgi:gliding motility-associated-like protein